MEKAWYKRKETWGAALTTLSSVLVLFEQKTVAYKVGIVLGVGLTAFGLRKGYKADNLPSGVTEVMDSIPNILTGKKGSKK